MDKVFGIDISTYQGGTNSKIIIEMLKQMA